MSSQARSHRDDSDLQIVFENRRLSFCGKHGTYTHKVLRQTGCFREYDLLADARRFLLPNDVVFDVGAHIGNHTIFFAAICQAIVFAFEPDEHNYGTLQRTVALNALQDRVAMYHAAVSSKIGFGHMVDGPRGTPATRRLSVASDGAVRVMRLDDTIPENPVRIIKIDVEGHELQVLLGATKLIERDRPRIYVECQTEARFADIAQHLADFGYRAIACFADAPTFAFSTAGADAFVTTSDLGFGVAAIHLRSVRKSNARGARKRQARRVAKAQSAQRREAQRAAKAEAALKRMTESRTRRMARLVTRPARKLRKLWRSTFRLQPARRDITG
jgi:FkbM family methyltransferase